MKIEKIKKTFSDYKVEISYGQLEAIAAALEADHSNPISDEMLMEIRFYLNNIPGPGEEEEDLKAREEGGMPPEAGQDDEMPVPMPPGQGAASEEGEPPVPDEAPEGDEPGAASPEDASPGDISPEDVSASISGDGPVPEPGMEGGAAPGEESVDEKLPEPPAE